MGKVLQRDAELGPVFEASASISSQECESVEACSDCYERDASVGSSSQRSQTYLCHCLEITERDVTEMVVTRGLTQLSEVIGCTGAGSGCTACHRAIRLHLERLGRSDDVASGSLPRLRPSAR